MGDISILRSKPTRVFYLLRILNSIWGMGRGGDEKINLASMTAVFIFSLGVGVVWSKRKLHQSITIQEIEERITRGDGMFDPSGNMRRKCNYFWEKKTESYSHGVKLLRQLDII
ncbi:hypothetical protein CDAR_205631 [Caerostris darwini]|uniref:Uncharacterized protein n=1 Tax=Caerostris darwini TaxID=1538125 RepID=A0AAV4WVH3_9ARAC|nr:hypothetical protein CDAR_205631 [Caerostris darwini]